MVEFLPSKQAVAGSSPVSRFFRKPSLWIGLTGQLMATGEILVMSRRFLEWSLPLQQKLASFFGKSLPMQTRKSLPPFCHEFRSHLMPFHPTRKGRIAWLTRIKKDPRFLVLTLPRMDARAPLLGTIPSLRHVLPHNATSSTESIPAAWNGPIRRNARMYRWHLSPKEVPRQQP